MITGCLSSINAVIFCLMEILCPQQEVSLKWLFFWRILDRALLCFCVSEKNADRKSADKKSVPGKASAFPGTLFIGGYEVRRGMLIC